jgi:hypothetical protein
MRREGDILTLVRGGDVLRERRRRGGGRAEKSTQMLWGLEEGRMWWGGARGCMRAIIGQGRGGKGRVRAGVTESMKTRRSDADAAVLLLLHASQDAHATACVCDGDRAIGSFRT